MQFLQVVDGKHVRDSRPRGSERPLLAAHNVWTLDGAKLRSGLHQWKPNLLQVLFGGTYNLAHLNVYFVGPIVGAVLGVVGYDFMTRVRQVGSAELGGIEKTAVEGK